MAKFKKREGITNDITVSDFMGTSSAPMKSNTDDKIDDITIGLSIEDIQDSTKNLTMFKNISAVQLMGITESDDKRAIFLSHLHQWKERSGWIAGKLLFEIQKKIEQDYNTWITKGEKEETKPEYITFKKWVEKHSPIMGFGLSSAKQYIWLYKHVEFEKAELGVKKQKIIQQIEDVKEREKIEKKALKANLNFKALQELVNKVQEKEEKEEIKSKSVKDNKNKNLNLTKDEEKDLYKILVSKIRVEEEKIKEEENSKSKKRIIAETRLEAFYEILDLINKDFII